MKSNQKKPHISYFLARRLLVVVGIFAFILSILMIANYIQTQTVDPLNSEALNQLMLELQKDPDNAQLKEQIRALDLLARKAYFTHQWQIRTGGFLLFGSVVVLLLLLKYLSTFRSKFSHLVDTLPEEKSWEARLLARKHVILAGILLFSAAFVLGVLSESGIDETGTGKAASASYASAEEMQQNWPSFRGPGGNGVAYYTDFPTEWNDSSGQNIAWKTPLPVAGFNSPIVWEKYVFLSAADKETQLVYCFDAESGETLWETALNSIPGSPAERPRVTEDTGYAAATMTTDGFRVFVIYATGDLACLDFEGNIIWSKNLGLPDNHYGHASSLMTHQNLLLVQFDHNESQQLIAFDTVTGREVYRQARDVLISWASPILVNTGERMELILSSNPYVISYNPENGQELWRVECMGAEVGPSPAYRDGMVFAVNEFARLAAIKLNGNAEMIWEYEDDLSEVASPVASADYLFIASSFGAVSCFDTKTGERYWMHEFEEGFYASPILVGNHVYLMDLAGMMHIFKADKSFNLVSETELGEAVMATPAFIDGRIYIRGTKHLFCIAKPNV